MELATATSAMSAAKLASSECTIEIHTLDNAPRLFAPAVRHGASIVFHNDLIETDVVVSFAGNSPFQGDNHFRIPPQQTIYKTIAPAANDGTYIFQATAISLSQTERSSLEPRPYWLTVEPGGINKVGFAFKPILSAESNFDVHIHQWAPRGQLEIKLANSTDSDIDLMVSDSPVKVPKQADYTIPAFQFLHDLTVQLGFHPEESGGTHVADILIEDP